MSSLPRRDLALLLVALLAAPALLAGAAQAQTTLGSDLWVKDVVIPNPRFLVATTITVTVENRGNADFSGTQGFQVFVGWNGVNDNNCVNAAPNEVNTNKPCYQRVNPGVGADNTIAKGATRTFTIPWTPRGAAAEQRGEGQLHVLISRVMPLSSSTWEAPDDSREGNHRTFPVTVHAPAVVAVPDRDAAPGQTDKNDEWRWEQIVERDAPDCLAHDQVNRLGCRATPGTTVRFAYTVHNVGTLADSFSGAVVFPRPGDEQALVDKGYRFTVTPAFVSIPFQGKATVYLDVHVPIGEQHNRGVNINGSGDTQNPKFRLEWRSSLNPEVTTEPPANTHCPSGFTCRNPAGPSLLAGVRRGMNVTSNETYKQVRTGQPVTFNARIENPGNYHDNYTVTLVTDGGTINESWRPRLNLPGVIPAGDARNASVDLLPPDGAVKGLHQFDLRVQSQGDPTGALVSNITFLADLQQRFGVLSSLQPSTSEVAPGQTATYDLTITNTGNGPDNATISLQNVPGGWDASLSRTQVQLPPLGRVSVQLNVTAPPGTVANTRAFLKINVTSQGSNNPSGFPAERAPEVTAEVLVLSRPYARMTLDGAARRFVDPGTTSEFVLTVQNVGNLASNFTLTPAPPDPPWGVSAVPPSIVLNPLESATMTVRLRAPQEAAVGETVRVVTTLRSVADPTHFAQETLVAMVSGPDLSVKGIVANRTTPYAGDPLALDVTLANDGNKAPGTNATLRLYFIQAGVERVIGERDFLSNDLPGGRRVSERFVWDTTGIEGPGVLLARIDPANVIKEIDESGTSNEASLALTLRTFDVTVSAPQALAGRPGEKVGYNAAPHVFLLRHRGNQATEPVRVQVESENGWVDPAASSIPLDLPRGVDVPVPIELLIPFRPGVSSDTLRITVVPEFRPEGTLTASVTTRVLDEERPVIAGVAARPDRAKIGENVTLEAIVRDATGIGAVTLNLVSPDNATTRLALAPVGGDRWALTQSFNAAGSYRFWVDAADKSDPPNVNSTRNALVDLFIDPGSAPLILLAEGQVTTVRSGTPVALNITDPAGIGRATYTIRGIAYTMDRTHRIDTSGFPAGPVDVTVEAENVYGAKSTARFTITIDNTPPGIRSVKLTPEDPDVNEDVTLRVETDAKVTAVDVLIRKDGRVVETRSMTRTGTGTFELLLNPGEGDYVLDVTAKDDAGNVKLQEGAVKFSAEPKSPFETPGPGFALVALALAGVALLARRRRA